MVDLLDLYHRHFENVFYYCWILSSNDFQDHFFWWGPWSLSKILVIYIDIFGYLRYMIFRDKFRWVLLFKSVIFWDASWGYFFIWFLRTISDELLDANQRYYGRFFRSNQNKLDWMVSNFSWNDNLKGQNDVFFGRMCTYCLIDWTIWRKKNQFATIQNSSISLISFESCKTYDSFFSSAL